MPESALNILEEFCGLEAEERSTESAEVILPTESLLKNSTKTMSLLI